MKRNGRRKLQEIVELNLLYSNSSMIIDSVKTPIAELRFKILQIYNQSKYLNELNQVDAKREFLRIVRS